MQAHIHASKHMESRPLYSAGTRLRAILQESVYQSGACTVKMSRPVS
jgi:hypothetical protein